MSEDWKAGDIAVCVADGVIRCPHRNDTVHTGRVTHARKGGIYRVTSTAPSYVETGDFFCGCIDLRLEGAGAGVSSRFRKLNDEPDDAKLIARIKKCKPIRSREHA